MTHNNTAIIGRMPWIISAPKRPSPPPTVKGPVSRTRLLRLYEVTQLRHTDCVHYDECLDRVVAKRWKSWACGVGCYER